MPGVFQSQKAAADDFKNVKCHPVMVEKRKTLKNLKREKKRLKRKRDSLTLTRT